MLVPAHDVDAEEPGIHGMLQVGVPEGVGIAVAFEDLQALKSMGACHQKRERKRMRERQRDKHRKEEREKKQILRSNLIILMDNCHKTRGQKCLALSFIRLLTRFTHSLDLFYNVSS